MAIQNIRIKYVVDTNDIEKADKSLDKLTASEKELKKEFDNVNKSAKNSFDTIEKGSDNVNNNVKKIAGTVASAFAISKVIDFGKEIINIRGEFQKLEAVLTNTLGSSSKAQSVLADIKTFAATTNFSVLELTNSFVKLANRGFIPTIQELQNLGDLANSTGKSFDQLTEAILDAQTGEFERLKEFGIRASKQGDQVKFAFKGVKTEVAFTSDAIKDYLVSLGELNGVQGSTEAISQTLSGQVSNLGDAYESLFNTIGEGSEGPLASLISGLSQALKFTEDLIKTDAQRNNEATVNHKNRLEQENKELVLKRLVQDFLIGKDNEYKKVFINNRTQEQAKDFDKFQSEIDNRKKAAEFTVRVLEQELETVDELNRGKSIAESLRNKAVLKEKLAAAKEFLDATLFLEAEKNAKTDVVDQKNLDKQYAIELRILAAKEDLARREAELSKADKTQLLAIEDDYNKKRIALFAKYNQTNIEELKDYKLKIREIENEGLEYLRGQETKYNDILQEENTAKLEIEQEYLNSKKTAEEQALNDSIDIILREEKERDKARKEREKKDAESANNRRQIEQELMQGIGMIYNEFKANADAQRQIEADENRTKENQELENVKGNKQAEANIKAKYDQIERKAKYEQAKANREQAIFNIGLATTEAVMRALAVPPAPNFILAGIAGGFGAVQLALTASRPLPKYAKGVERLEGEGTETSDSILAQLSRGERVVTARENKDYFPALTAIHNRHIPPELLNNFVMNYDQIQRPNLVMIGSDNSGLERELKTVSKKLDNLKQVNINIDKGGINAYLSTKNANIELANNYVVI